MPYNKIVEYQRTGRNTVSIKGDPKDVKSILRQDTWSRIIELIIWIVAGIIALSVNGESLPFIALYLHIFIIGKKLCKHFATTFQCHT